MRNNILIVGAGQLGSRYLQGLSQCSVALNVCVYDPSDLALIKSLERFNEVNNDNVKHKINLLNSMDDLPKEFDIAIISTTADVRAEVVERLTIICKINYWILEKVLATSLSDLDRIDRCIKPSKFAWVNTPRRMMFWYQELARQIAQELPTLISFSGGGWGLACNSIHFIDFANFIFDENLLWINTENLNSTWYESKRAGFFEVNGKLIAKFNNNKTLMLECLDSNAPNNIHIKTNKGEWLINESNGQAINPEGKVIEGHLDLQSEMTARLLESILFLGTCELPSLDKSVAFHKPFLQSMLMHWNQSNGTSDVNLRIT